MNYGPTTIHADGTITRPSPFPVGCPVGTKGITPIDPPSMDDETPDIKHLELQWANQDEYFAKHGIDPEIQLQD